MLSAPDIVSLYKTFPHPSASPSASRWEQEPASGLGLRATALATFGLFSPSSPQAGLSGVRSPVQDVAASLERLHEAISQDHRPRSASSGSESLALIKPLHVSTMPQQTAISAAHSYSRSLSKSIQKNLLFMFHPRACIEDEPLAASAPSPDATPSPRRSGRTASRILAVDVSGNRCNGLLSPTATLAGQGHAALSLLPLGGASALLPLLYLPHMDSGDVASAKQANHSDDLIHYNIYTGEILRGEKASDQMSHYFAREADSLASRGESSEEEQSSGKCGLLWIPKLVAAPLGPNEYIQVPISCDLCLLHLICCRLCRLCEY